MNVNEGRLSDWRKYNKMMLENSYNAKERKNSFCKENSVKRWKIMSRISKAFAGMKYKGQKSSN